MCVAFPSSTACARVVAETSGAFRGAKPNSVASVLPAPKRASTQALRLSSAARRVVSAASRLLMAPR